MFKTIAFASYTPGGDKPLGGFTDFEVIVFIGFLQSDCIQTPIRL